MTATTPYRVLLSLQDDAQFTDWVALAARLAPGNAELHVRGLVVVPPEQSLSEGAIPARHWREAFQVPGLEDAEASDRARVYVDYQPLRRVVADVGELAADLLIVQWLGPDALTGGVETDEILKTAPCDVVLISRGLPPAAGPVLLSLRGGPNLSLGLRVAKGLAGSASITLFHAADRQRSAPDLEMMMRADPQIQRTVTSASALSDGILLEASRHQSLVLGARLEQPAAAASASGPIVRHLYAATDLPLVLVRSKAPESLDFHIPGRLKAAPEDISTRVDRWFAENTFDSREFADLSALLALKEQQGVTISLGLPALNEAATVGTVIGTLKRALMDDLPLIDEIVLIDSRSTDQTVAIAQAAGVPAYVHQDLLPEVGALAGKGEALWKSLYVLKGDIIVWVDTDITNIHPRFIYGLLGPLLKHPHIQYVKGFYRRPMLVGDKLQVAGGGRVTELVARPLFNLFYPELSGIIQPLSGEYAGRRSALEQVPFFSGYGVETGLLIDLLETCGLNCIAQSDLEVRIHHNQPLIGLSKMSFAILQVFMARLEKRFGVEMLEAANRSMKTIIQEPERFGLEINNIGDVERPPMLSLPAYQNR